MKKYLKIWWIFTLGSFQIQMNIRWGLGLFLFAKVLRFATFTIFLVILLKSTKVLAGYNLDQIILFFLSFNFIDVLSQLLFREVYRFRQKVLSGAFDFYLIKPVSPLFRSLFTGADILDFITLIPLIWAIIYFINKMHLMEISNLLIYFLMLSLGFLIACSCHILVLSLGILTTEIDNAIMLYRDIVGLGRMPIDIYMEPVRSLLTFVIPVAVMMTFPAKTLMGLLSFQFIFYSSIYTFLLFFLSLKSWDFALKNYSSASS
ncbi:ABC-2 family transporter protein [Candidatus Daviesbacteria bacterium]|nr:ABC-2 family transporter protein [Candidatus Daviesbacteria bacterium]